jgi:3-deoxy-D-manno-octulosonic-acid transferase
MILFYQLFLRFYFFFIWFASAWNSKAKKWIEGRQNWQQLLAKRWQLIPGHPVLWMHCASLGEFEQGRPVLDKLKLQNPNLKILLTFFSPSGYEVRKNYMGADLVMYLPADSEKNAKQFIAAVQPSLVIFVKYEFWHFYLSELKKQSIPAILVAGIFRQTQPFFRWWGFFHRNMLHCFNHLFVQNEASQHLLESVGLAGKISVCGDTRFDRVVELADSPKPIQIAEAFRHGRNLLVAGSTWKEDEELIAGWFSKHKKDWQLIIAPHEVEQKNIERLLQLFPTAVTYSAIQNQTNSSQKKEVLIIDNIGMLSNLYSYGTVCYVGGGFNKSGHHNILEAAVYGKAVFTGPVFEKFSESIELKKLGASFTVHNPAELEQLIQKTDLENAGRIAAEYVYRKSGAKKFITEWIQEKRLLTSE